MVDIIIELWLCVWLYKTLYSVLYFATIVFQIVLHAAKNDFGFWYNLATGIVYIYYIVYMSMPNTFVTHL